MGCFRLEAIGRLTNAPELEKIQVNGEEVSLVKFGLAVNTGFGDNQQTEFLNCVAWRKLADIMSQHLDKGRKIWIEARPKRRKFPITKDGVEFNTERTDFIVEEFEFCDDRGSNGDNNNGDYQSQQQAPSHQGTSPRPVRRAPF